jgi:hypothetical protein
MRTISVLEERLAKQRCVPQPDKKQNNDHNFTVET